MTKLLAWTGTCMADEETRSMWESIAGEGGTRMGDDEGEYM